MAAGVELNRATPYRFERRQGLINHRGTFKHLGAVLPDATKEISIPPVFTLG